MPKRAEPRKIFCPAPILTILLIQDAGRIMVKCPELDLVTEMDTPQEALRAMIEMIQEYAEDYRAREKIFTASPNRAHHKPYIDRVLACRDEWELWELIEIRHGHLHLPAGAQRVAKARV